VQLGPAIRGGASSPQNSRRDGVRACRYGGIALALTLSLGGCSYSNSEIASAGSPARGAANEVAALPTPPAPAPKPAPRPARAKTPKRRPSSAAAGQAFPADEQPLVVIRFAQPNVDYAQPLYTAVNAALQRKPSAAFTIQAASPSADTTAETKAAIAASQQDAAKVFHALREMGMPSDRLSLAATTIPNLEAREVRVYVH